MLQMPESGSPASMRKWPQEDQEHVLDVLVGLVPLWGICPSQGGGGGNPWLCCMWHFPESLGG